AHPPRAVWASLGRLQLHPQRFRVVPMTAAALPARLPVVRALDGWGARPLPGLGNWPAGDGRQPPAGAPAGRSQELCAPVKAPLWCRVMPTGCLQVILESGRSAREWVLVG